MDLPSFLAFVRQWVTIENVAVVFGIVSVYVSVREHIWSWPTAIVNVLLYVIVFREAKLYADMGLQVVYAVISAYGWYHWLFGGAGRTELPVTRVPPREALVLLALATGGTLALGSFFARHTDAAFPFLDSGLASASLAAQWMMTRKYVENWAVWILVDVVYVPMYVLKHLVPTALLYAVFLGLAVLGLMEWWRSWKGGTAAVTPAAS